jgi:hypothetical protein
VAVGALSGGDIDVTAEQAPDCDIGSGADMLAVDVGGAAGVAISVNGSGGVGAPATAGALLPGTGDWVISK